ncbi:MAG: phosphate propanoyltransferase [Erysipelotrichaceae bacterium]|nr:phosphate propanoyltransferase [Erysipelotrichaceae bacterium]
MENNKILVEISARHVHVSEEHLAILFGEGYKLTPKKDLSQPGQFACEERVDLVGERGTLKSVTILGPTRPFSQVEVTSTEARTLGVKALIRESGLIDGTFGCTLVGPKGSVVLDKGVIVAKRHIHVTPSEAQAYGVSDKEIIMVEVTSEDRSLIFGDVVVRVSEKFAAAMHIDTDEANAAGLSGAVFGEIKRV